MDTYIHIVKVDIIIFTGTFIFPLIFRKYWFAHVRFHYLLTKDPGEAEKRRYLDDDDVVL